MIKADFYLEIEYLAHLHVHKALSKQHLQPQVVQQQTYLQRFQRVAKPQNSFLAKEQFQFY